MTFDERTGAVAKLGFTERQARFLVTVILHSGVCVPRQYARFAGIVHGQKTRKFFAKLVRLEYASTHDSGTIAPSCITSTTGGCIALSATRRAAFDVLSLSARPSTG